nr:PREDICTED: uncharacterized protein LOC109038906 [Bemisia tabaci]
MKEAVGRVIYLLVFLVPGTLPIPACRISEFPCRNGRCIRLDQYCNGIADCPDKSDEPRYCTVCNRTYYGDIPTTYSLSLPRPKDEKLPFLCHLTFTANGRENGELVQLMFESFELGRYEAASPEGCPDGHMQLSELGRPFTGGFWCGAASAPAVYFTETSTVTITLRLFQPPSGTQAPPFSFRLRYKFVGDEAAVVRFGTLAAPLERGDIVPGTYCSRNFYECYFKRCRIQSPNYPGIYPRNVTCYLTIRQKKVPTCKHAMISVRQDNGHKMQIRSLREGASASATGGTSGVQAGTNRTERRLRVWEDCTSERDHLMFYDGASTDDPLLVKYCGGDWLPKIVSRGPVMLVTFHSSPYSVPLSPPGATSPLRGFELDVDILFSDSDSLDFARQSRSCEFLVNASHPDSDDAMQRSRGREGFVLSPRHTLPANSTCVYRFRGSEADLVWLYFVSYAHHPLRQRNASHVAVPERESCATRLRIWDGGGSVLGDHCDAPKLCDHATLANATRRGRPCSIEESYVSFSNSIVIQHKSTPGTALHPASFRLRYEFVDTRLGGEPYFGRKDDDVPTTTCSRLFRKMRSGQIHTPKNVFLYGRGGTANLSCYYRIEAGPGERVQLTIRNVSFGERAECYTEADPHTGRYVCARSPERAARKNYELLVTEAPWRDVRTAKACICNNATSAAAQQALNTLQALTFTSATKVLELTFKIFNMNMTEDYKDVYFYAEFEMVRAADCARKQRLRGSGGEIEFANPPQSRADKQCFGAPWFIEANENKSLFLMTWGHLLPLHPAPDEPVKCHTRNRILLYYGTTKRLSHVICPALHSSRQSELHIFSEEWFGYQEEDETHGGGPLQNPRTPNFLLEFVAREPGGATVNWLEVSRPKSSFLKQLHPSSELIEEQTIGVVGPVVGGNTTDPGCPHKCHDLNACISAVLWCDGVRNCPDGSDENPAVCGVSRLIFTLLPTYAILGGGVASSAACFVVLCFLALHRSHQRKRRLLGADKMGASQRAPTEEFLVNSQGSLASS